MNERTALVLREGELAELMTIADAAAKSGLFPDTKVQAQAIVKILMGRELGVGPMQSLAGIDVIEGKPAPGAGLMAALIKESRKYDYRIRELTNDNCVLEFFEEGKPIGLSAFTRADAERAGLVGKVNWKTYPRNMLFARALSNGQRWFCPDVGGGALYTPEELGKDEGAELVVDEAKEPIIDGATGEVEEAPSATAVEEPGKAEPAAGPRPGDFTLRLWDRLGKIDVSFVAPLRRWNSLRKAFPDLPESTTPARAIEEALCHQLTVEQVNKYNRSLGARIAKLMAQQANGKAVSGDDHGKDGA